jgi:hypothetical protein
MAKKITAGMIAKAPVKKVVKKTTPAKLGVLYKAPPKGTVEYARYELMKAMQGGAAKEATNRTKPKKIGSEPKYYFTQDGARGASRAKKDIYEYSKPGDKERIEKQILKQKAKDVQRAQVAALAAKKKKK